MQIISTTKLAIKNIMVGADLLQKAAQSLFFLNAFEQAASQKTNFFSNNNNKNNVTIEEITDGDDDDNDVGRGRLVEKKYGSYNNKLGGDDDNVVKDALTNYAIWKALLFPSVTVFIVMTEKKVFIWIKLVVFSLFVAHILFIGGFSILPQVYKDIV
ncbi:LbFV_orf54-like [Cotesia congregata filamentous virus 1]|uniref:LbFV_orf54-like n=1 Tax=Cotesia congregata filamentous virus 1 TaxID=3064291 RepID=A0ABC8QJU9_9VIRU|nr:LbFV_orf54-like [Cotesia congregata filamentous virus 1]